MLSREQDYLPLHYLTRSRLYLVWLFCTGILLISSVCLGTIGFNKVDEFTFQESLYSSFRLFFLDFDLPPENHNIPVLLDIARWIAPITVFLSVILGVIISFIQQLRIWLLRWSRSHIVISGVNSYSYELIVDLLNKGKKVVVIEPDPRNPYLNHVVQLGGIVLIGESTDARVLHAARAVQCRRLVLFAMDDTDNIESLLQFGGVLGDRRTMSVHILLQNRRFVDLVEDVVEQIDGERADKLDVRIFNHYEITAHLLFQKYPLFKGRDINDSRAEAMHLMIIGFGNIGEQVLLQAANLLHFPNGIPAKITIIDPNAKSIENGFRQRFATLNQAVDFTFHNDDAHGIEFMRFVEQQKPGYIVVCTGNDQDNLEIGMNLVERLANIPVHVKIGRKAEIATRIDSHSGKYKNLYRFGDLTELANEDMIINERLDVVARAIHESYNVLTGGATRWEDLSMFMKGSNRAQADQMLTKLYALGLKMVEGHAPHALTEDEYSTEVDKVIETLAIAEHRRWNAFHFIHGWQPGEKRDFNKKLHPALVPWEELDAVSEMQSQLQKKNINYKESDRNTVKRIRNIADFVGYSIIRLNEEEQHDVLSQTDRYLKGTGS